jgi:FkbM family methyltransferase
MSLFVEHLLKEISDNLPNCFKDNYDYYRFGKLPYSQRIKKEVKSLLSKRNLIIFNNSNFKSNFEIISKYFSKLGVFYYLLSDQKSKDLLVKLVAYKLLGEEKVKLPLNNQKFWHDLSELEKNKYETNEIGFVLGGWKLSRFEMEKFGFPINLYSFIPAVYCTFCARQYEYISTNNQKIRVEQGDIVLDIGACSGDTALYFADRIQGKGLVYSFEFIPSNLNILRKNLNLNSELSKLIKVIEKPVWSQTGKKLKYIDNGPGSKVTFDDLKEFNGVTDTISIDDFVKENNLSKVDFIKMDIEGAETHALKGATETLLRFKPKLAIAIYHSFDDFVEIPLFLNSLNLNYRLFLGHFTIHSEETILFAI